MQANNKQPMSIAVVKRAVHATIAKHLGGVKATEAIAILEAMLADGVFRVSSFANTIADKWGIDDSLRASIQQDLRSHLVTGSGDSTESNPSQTAQVTLLRPSTDTGPNDSDEFKIFVMLINTMHGMLSKHKDIQQNQLDECFKQEMTEMNLPSTLLYELSNWVVRPETLHVSSPMQEKTMSLVVHALYNAISTLLGPVQADRILTDSVKRVEDNPLSANFSPKAFL